MLALFKDVSTRFGRSHTCNIVTTKTCDRSHASRISVASTLNHKAIQCISMLLFVVFCKPILAMLLQRKRVIARTRISHVDFCCVLSTYSCMCHEHDASHVVVFCKPVLATLLQNKTLDRSHASLILLFVVFCKPMLAIQ